MRVCSVLALLLLSCSLMAQISSTEETKKTFPSDQVSQSNKAYFDLGAANQSRGQARFDSDARTCFFIRSYNFERQGTQAPKLKNMTTCTPAKSDQFRQTNRPKVKLIPAN